MGHLSKQAVGRIALVSVVVVLSGCTFDHRGLPAWGQSDGNLVGPDGPMSPKDGKVLPKDRHLPAPDRMPRFDGRRPDTRRHDLSAVADRDSDKKPDKTDNCPNTYNPGQANADGDKHGDACDNCDKVKNDGQSDVDHDDVGDVCDNCRNKKNKTQTNSDGDKYGDECDNCDQVKNDGQSDLDLDGKGDACDTDKDGDTVINGKDPRPSTKDKVYWAKSFSTFSSQFERTAYSAWTLNRTQLCIAASNSPHHHRAVLSPAPTSPDVLVQTLVRVSASTSVPSQRVGAGLLLGYFRAGGVSYSALCAVDLANKKLLLGTLEAVSNKTTVLASQQVSLGSTSLTSFVLKALSKGKTLSCTFGPTGKTIKHTFGPNAKGSVGVFAERTNVCFDHLTVVAAP